MGATPKNPNAETRHNQEEEAFVNAIAAQYKCTAVQVKRLMIRYVLDNVSHNDFATFVLQQKDETDRRLYDEKDARLKGKASADASA